MPTDCDFLIRWMRSNECWWAGRVPLAVCANAGSINTGAIDPLAEVAELCREHHVWRHVDAAYGGFAALTACGRELLRALELADSVTLDPHKWLFQPFECGAVLVREPGALRQAFQITPDYLQDVRADTTVNLSDRGLQLASRLPSWASSPRFAIRPVWATSRL